MDMIFEDSAADKAERTHLLDELDALVKGEPFSRELWACLWLADLDRLRSIVADTRNVKYPAELLNGFQVRVINSNLVRHWKQQTRNVSRPTSAASTPLRPSTPTLPEVSESPTTELSGSRKRRRDGLLRRDRLQSDRCRERDQNLCVLTKAGDPEVAHIFPFAMRHLQTEEARAEPFSPWACLKLFWTEEKVNQWFSAIQATTETPRNLFCLCPNAHAYQAKGYFALKNIGNSEDNTSQTVMFVWMPDFNNSPSTLRVCTDPSTCTESVVRFRKVATGGVVGLLDTLTGLPTASGDQIILQTPDPVNLPLPDPDLLELHWVLQRVVAMAAGAEPTEMIQNDTDSDDEYGTMIYDDSDASDLYPSKKPAISSSILDNEKGMAPRLDVSLGPCCTK
ncbi:hypothetical protein FQN55_007792 [Onygenales sp. PD_40]|nr:hypothetical protein FQN55_007792 [Onygenales sp. PD_40]KAK2787285.1 hypothetical protein FQN53_005444 [Emmonsiellopsis sp. PD_33]KAK2805168.1 hypothetical protein FQN51_000691 [Onygenales sp. PD_10]